VATWAVFRVAELGNRFQPVLKVRFSKIFFVTLCEFVDFGYAAHATCARRAAPTEFKNMAHIVSRDACADHEANSMGDPAMGIKAAGVIMSPPKPATKPAVKAATKKAPARGADGGGRRSGGGTARGGGYSN
jgi:hypothetical protein